MKNFRVALLVVVFPLLVIALGIAAYLLWPVWFPKYAPGSCLKDEQAKRVYLVVGYDDWFKGAGIPAIVLQAAAGTPGAYQLGDETRVQGDDIALVPVACPRAGVELIGPINQVPVPGEH